ncbi:Sugar transporter, conserved site,Major facilitator superfamily domain,Major facilitator, sugar [Cinara cedri]|uniref:Sugar transporter, conserved site,Major facilitator superfamily domain,Major facilitator, sugar n=1 Tax=Cinara cedri TaxID=506608 RepID=A0A5E4M9X4_9HEMI|nr:Sugar transporter, conserved site,Major facilitator superfamily domain,Major facilitator, sugar [Cinara cedri]
MSKVPVDENEKLNPDQINSGKRDADNKSTNTIITVDNNEEHEDNQHTFVSTNSNKKTYVEGDKNSDPKLLWTDLCPQILFCCIALFMACQPGINLAYSNNLLHYMPSLNNGQFSWITSILALFTPVGALFIGVIMDRIGRKKSCLLTCIPLLMSWILGALSSSDSIYLFVVSRTLAGIGAGMTTVGLVYVAEISHSSYKQLFLALNSVFFSGGVLLSTSILQLSWNVINFAFIGFTVINMALIVLFMPESPIWLLKFQSPGHVTKAKAAVKRIYSQNHQVFQAEWSRLKTMSAGNEATANDHRPSFFTSLRTSPAAYKPFGIMVMLIFLQQVTGVYPVISYALFIHKSIVPDAFSVSEIQFVTVLGAVRFAGALFVCPLSFYVGRKPLLTVSCLGMTLSAVLVVFANRKTSQPADDAAVAMSSICCVLLYVFSSSLGVLAFPWTLTCELLSTSIRAVGGCILVSYAYLLMFVVMKVFPYIWEAIGVDGVFAVFGIMSLAMAVYVHLVLPETLGKSFKEIEDYFTAGTSSEK